MRQPDLTQRFIGAGIEEETSNCAEVANIEGETMNTYTVKLRYEDREKGSDEKTVKVDATTIAGAIARAAREFIKGLDRKQRFDANKGLHIEAARVADKEGDATESAKGTTA
jgi:hypothetical protein